MTLNYFWLAIVLVVFGWIVLALPMHYLVLADLQTVIFKDFWNLGGVRTDPTDFMIGALAVALLLRGRPKDTGSRLGMPFPLAFFLLGLWLSISYVSVPVNQPNLTDPARIAYQLYRYCWKPLLYLPICFFFIRSPGRLQVFLNALFVGTNMIALQTIYQGHTGQDPRGPFDTGNTVAGVMVMPAVMAVATMLFPISKRQFYFSAASSLIMARAIMMSGSRGGALATGAGIGFLLAGMMLVHMGRKRLLQLIPVALLVPLLILVVVPDVFDRPHVKRLMTVSQGTEVDNLQWRISLRWPHFWALAWQHPWVGRGSDVDLSLGKEANTPHNGYISIAVRYGFPVLLCFIYLALRTLWTGVGRFLRSRDQRTRIFYLTLISPIVAMLVHNVVEVTWTDYPVLKTFWMIVAVVALSVRSPEDLVLRPEDERLALEEERRELEEAWDEEEWGDDEWGDDEWSDAWDEDEEKWVA